MATGQEQTWHPVKPKVFLAAQGAAWQLSTGAAKVLATSCHAPASAGRDGAGELRIMSLSLRAWAGLAVPILELGALPPTPAAPAALGSPYQPLNNVMPLGRTPQQLLHSPAEWGGGPEH